MLKPGVHNKQRGNSHKILHNQKEPTKSQVPLLRKGNGKRGYKDSIILERGGNLNYIIF